MKSKPEHAEKHAKKKSQEDVGKFYTTDDHDGQVREEVKLKVTEGGEQAFDFAIEPRELYDKLPPLDLVKLLNDMSPSQRLEFSAYARQIRTLLPTSESKVNPVPEVDFVTGTVLVDEPLIPDVAHTTNEGRVAITCKTCKTCGGSTKIITFSRGLFGETSKVVRCPNCDENGIRYPEEELLEAGTVYDIRWYHLVEHMWNKLVNIFTRNNKNGK